MQEIRFNPFRYLGIFANATMKEQSAQTAQMNAYARVGQKFDNPLQLQHLLEPLPDDEECIRDAESMIALEHEREFYTAFWFVHGTNPDEDLEAVSLLDKGKTSQALAIWSRRDDPEALQNLIVAYLVLGKWEPALEVAQRLYRQESEIRRFAHAVTEGFDLKMKKFADAVGDNSLWTSTMKDLLKEAYRKQIKEAIDDNDASLLDAVYDLYCLREIIGSIDANCQILAEQLAKALADQYIYSSDIQYVTKCLNKAYDITEDEETKALISERLVSIVEHDEWGRAGVRMDIPKVRKAQIEQIWIYFGVVLLVFVVIFFVGRCTQSKKRKQQIPEQSVPEVQAPKFEDMKRPYVTIFEYPTIIGDSIVWKKADKPLKVPKETEEEFRKSMEHLYKDKGLSPERTEKEIQMLLEAGSSIGRILTQEEIDSIKSANGIKDK